MSENERIDELYARIALVILAARASKEIALVTLSRMLITGLVDGATNKEISKAEINRYLDTVRLIALAELEEYLNVNKNVMKNLELKIYNLNKAPKVEVNEKLDIPRMLKAPPKED